MRKSFLKNNEGITLIEVLLSIVILSIIAVTLLTYFANHFRFFYDREIEAQTIRLASEAIEVIKSRYRDDWNYTPDNTDILNIITQNADLRAVYELNITEVIIANTDDSLKRVTVKVKVGSEDKASLVTLIAEEG
ncbi:type IV pilus modification PilV family protein [Natronospora cellulosivora (SeqCode)]